MFWQGQNNKVSYPRHGWDILPATGMGHTIPVTDRASHPCHGWDVLSQCSIPVMGRMSQPCSGRAYIIDTINAGNYWFIQVSFMCQSLMAVKREGRREYKELEMKTRFAGHF